MKETFSVVGFLARSHGTNGLAHVIASERYHPACIFTHRLNPKSQDPGQAQRGEYAEMESLCDIHRIPLHTIDSNKEAMKIDGILARSGKFDFMVSISWRRVIPVHQLRLPGIGGVNLHRGKLPDYKGAEPIKQALHNKDNFITITSHHLSEEIDSGETIATCTHPVNFDTGCSMNTNITRLKRELTPHFGPLLIESMDSMVDRYESR